MTRWIWIVCLVGLSCGGDRPPQGTDAAPGVSERVVTDSTRVGPYALTVADEGGWCYLGVEGPSGTGRLALAPGPPCYFVRRESSTPQSFSYPDVGVEAVLIVAGTPIDAAKRTQWNLSDDLVCGEEAQGVLVVQEGVRLSRQVLAGGVACKDKGLDEKDFWSFAHE